MTKKINEKLVVSAEVRRQLMGEFSIVERTIYAALAFKTAGEQPDAIRARAIELGARRQCTYTA